MVAPTGLPIFDLVYRNDDGGPMYGKDSRVTFTAPAAGTYYFRLTDSRAAAGPSTRTGSRWRRPPRTTTCS